MIDILGETFSGRRSVVPLDRDPGGGAVRRGSTRARETPVPAVVAADSGHGARNRTSERVSKRTDEGACVRACVRAACVRAREQEIRLVIASLALRRSLSLWRLCVSPSVRVRSFVPERRAPIPSEHVDLHVAPGSREQRRCQRRLIEGLTAPGREGSSRRKCVPVYGRFLPREDNARRRTIRRAPSPPMTDYSLASLRISIRRTTSRTVALEKVTLPQRQPNAY